MCIIVFVKNEMWLPVWMSFCNFNEKESYACQRYCLRVRKEVAEEFEEIDGQSCNRLAKIGIYRRYDGWKGRRCVRNRRIVGHPSRGCNHLAQCRPWKSILVTSRQTGAVDSPSKSPSPFRPPDRALLPLLARIRNEIKILQETETSRSSSTVSSHSTFRGRERRAAPCPLASRCPGDKGNERSRLPCEIS